MVRKLSDEQERCALAIYLCGVSSERIQRRYNISKFTLKDSILYNRSCKWNDPLIELYRKTKHSQRLRNSAHLYLAFHDTDVPWKKLVEQERDKQIYRAIEKNIYLPRTKQVIENTSLGLNAK